MDLGLTVRRFATSDFIAAQSDKLETFRLPVCIYAVHRRPYEVKQLLVSRLIGEVVLAGTPLVRLARLSGTCH
jgi:hypothetical protein